MSCLIKYKMTYPKNRKSHSCSEETKQKIRSALLGKKRPKETIEKMSQSLKDGYASGRLKPTNGCFQKGFKHTDEWKTQNSQRMSGSNHPNWQGKQRNIICKTCEKVFYGHIDRKFCSHNCYAKWLIVSETQKGENCYFWKGGIYKKKYPDVWNESLKEYIRERDNYTCQICGINQKKLSISLHVHHINENKNDCSEENLVSLCPKCHITLHGRKEVFSWHS